MKFLKIFAVVLVAMELFLFMGGYMLFDFKRSYYGAGVACALVIAIIVYAFGLQNARIEALENRIQEMENNK